MSRPPAQQLDYANRARVQWKLTEEELSVAVGATMDELEALRNKETSLPIRCVHWLRALFTRQPEYDWPDAGPACRAALATGDPIPLWTYVLSTDGDVTLMNIPLKTR